MLDILPTTDIMPSGLKESIAFENAAYELQSSQSHLKQSIGYDLRASQQIKQEVDKMKKLNLDIMKGLMIPDRTGEQEIRREFEWWEEEMKHREALRNLQNEKKEQAIAELADLRTKEQNLDRLKNALEKKKEEISLKEEELEDIQKDFEQRLKVQVLAALESAGSSEIETSKDRRMKEEAQRRAIKKSLRQTGDDDQQAKNLVLQKLDEKIELEKDIARLSKDIGLMKQKMRGRVKSFTHNIEQIKKHRESIGPREIPPNDILYAPKAYPPRPVVLSSYQRRLEEAKAEKAERRSKLMAQRKQQMKKRRANKLAAAANNTLETTNNNGSSSSSSSSKPSTSDIMESDN